MRLPACLTHVERNIYKTLQLHPLHRTYRAGSHVLEQLLPLQQFTPPKLLTVTQLFWLTTLSLMVTTSSAAHGNSLLLGRNKK